MTYIGLDIETYPCLFLVKAKDSDGNWHTYKANKFVDCGKIRTFVKGIQSFDWVVTYNGTAFDLRVLAWLANYPKPWVKVGKVAEEAHKLITDMNDAKLGFVATSDCWNVPKIKMNAIRKNHCDVFRCYTIDKTKSLKHWELYNGWSVKETDVDFDATSMTEEEEELCERYCEHDVEAELGLFLKPDCQETLTTRKWVEDNCEVVVLPDNRPPDLAEIYCYGDDVVSEDGNCYDMIPWDEFSNLPSKFLDQMKMLARGGIDGFKWNGITYGKGGAHYAAKGAHNNVHIFDVASMYPHIVKHYVPLKTRKATERYVGCLAKRLELKRLKGTEKYSKAMDLGLKLVLNSITGKFRQQGALAYAPQSGLAMCIIGQLIITDAICYVCGDNFANLIEANTDSFAVVGDEEIKRAQDYCSKVQHNMTFEEEVFPISYWKDVNNYIVYNEDGGLKETHGTDSSDLVKKGNEPVVVKSLFQNLLLPEGGKPVLKGAEMYKDYVVKYSRPATTKNATIDGVPITKKHYYFLWVTADCPDAHAIEFSSDRIDKSNGLIKSRRGVYAFDTDTIAKYFKYIDRSQYVMDLKALLCVWNRGDLCAEYAEKLQRSKVIARNKALRQAKTLEEIVAIMNHTYNVSFEEPKP